MSFKACVSGFLAEFPSSASNAGEGGHQSASQPAGDRVPPAKAPQSPTGSEHNSAADADLVNKLTGDIARCDDGECAVAALHGTSGTDHRGDAKQQGLEGEDQEVCS